eukprot:Awhi_evm1s672
MAYRTKRKNVISTARGNGASTLKKNASLSSSNHTNVNRSSLGSSSQPSHIGMQPSLPPVGMQPSLPPVGLKNSSHHDGRQSDNRPLSLAEFNEMPQEYFSAAPLSPPLSKGSLSSSLSNIPPSHSSLPSIPSTHPSLPPIQNSSSIKNLPPIPTSRPVSESFDQLNINGNNESPVEPNDDDEYLNPLDILNNGQNNDNSLPSTLPPNLPPLGSLKLPSLDHIPSPQIPPSPPSNRALPSVGNKKPPLPSPTSSPKPSLPQPRARTSIIQDDEYMCVEEAQVPAADQEYMCCFEPEVPGSDSKGESASSAGDYWARATEESDSSQQTSDSDIRIRTGSPLSSHSSRSVTVSLPTKPDFGTPVAQRKSTSMRSPQEIQGFKKEPDPAFEARPPIKHRKAIRRKA